MAKRLVQSERVDGFGGRYVRIGFYDDGSVSIRITSAGPMVITEAYVQGQMKYMILAVAPAPSV